MSYYCQCCDMPQHRRGVKACIHFKRECNHVAHVTRRNGRPVRVCVICGRELMGQTTLDGVE